MFENFGQEDLLELLVAYDKYIQEANDDDKYQNGWRPVCINEFYDNDFEFYK